MSKPKEKPAQEIFVCVACGNESMAPKPEKCPTCGQAKFKAKE